MKKKKAEIIKVNQFSENSLKTKATVKCQNQPHCNHHQHVRYFSGSTNSLTLVFFLHTTQYFRQQDLQEAFKYQIGIKITMQSYYSLLIMCIY